MDRLFLKATVLLAAIFFAGIFSDGTLVFSYLG